MNTPTTITVLLVSLLLTSCRDAGPNTKASNNSATTVEPEPFSLLPLTEENMQLFTGWSILHRTIGQYDIVHYYDGCYRIAIDVYDNEDNSGYWDDDYNKNIFKARYTTKPFSLYSRNKADSLDVMSRYNDYAMKAVKKVDLFRKMRLLYVDYFCKGDEIWIYKDSSAYIYTNKPSKKSDSLHQTKGFIKLSANLYQIPDPGGPY